MGNVLDKAGATKVQFFQINNTYADLLANLQPCQFGLETDSGRVGYKDNLGNYHRSLTYSGASGYLMKADTDGNASQATNTDAQVAAAVSATHARQHGLSSTSDHTSAISQGYLMKADANGLPTQATNTDSDVSSAVSLKHPQQHAINSTSDHTASILTNYVLIADAHGLPSQGTNTDSQVAGAVSNSHSRQHAIDSTSDHTSSISQKYLMKANANGLPSQSQVRDDGTTVSIGVAPQAGRRLTVDAPDGDTKGLSLSLAGTEYGSLQTVAAGTSGINLGLRIYSVSADESTEALKLDGVAYNGSLLSPAVRLKASKSGGNVIGNTEMILEIDNLNTSKFILLGDGTLQLPKYTSTGYMKITDANGTVGVGSIQAGDLPTHALAGSAHSSDTITNLNTKLSDGSLLTSKTGEINAFTSKTPVSADVLVIEDSNASWAKKKITVGSIAASAHNILSTTHGDSTAGSVSRGDIITGQGASPTWSRLALGTDKKYLRSNGTDASWSALLTGDMPNPLQLTAVSPQFSAISSADYGSAQFFAENDVLSTMTMEVFGSNYGGTYAGINYKNAAFLISSSIDNLLVISDKSSSKISLCVNGTVIEQLASGGVTIPAFSSAGFVKNSAAGLLSSGLIGASDLPQHGLSTSSVHSSSISSGYMMKADANGLPAQATNTDTQVSGAVTNSHAASGQFNQATSGEIAGLTSKATPVSNDLILIEDSAASNAKKKVTVGSLPGGTPSAHASTHALGGSDQITLWPSYYFLADQFEYPNSSDWAVNSSAPVVSDTTSVGLMVRRLDDSSEEGVGFTLLVPTSATNLTFYFRSKAETAPGSAKKVKIRIYKREISDNAAVGAWSSAYALTDIDIPTNVYFQLDSQTVSLASLGVTAGNLVQFELTRNGADAGDTLSGDWDLLSVRVVVS